MRSCEVGFWAPLGEGFGWFRSVPVAPASLLARLLMGQGPTTVLVVVHVCMCMCVCVYVYVYMCVCVCVFVCVEGRGGGGGASAEGLIRNGGNREGLMFWARRRGRVVQLARARHLLAVLAEARGCCCCCCRLHCITNGLDMMGEGCLEMRAGSPHREETSPVPSAAVFCRLSGSDLLTGGRRASGASAAGG